MYTKKGDFVKRFLRFAVPKKRFSSIGMMKMSSTSGQREIVVCHDGAALAAEAVGRIVAASLEAIAQRGRFTLVLSGGSTPEQTYTLLAQPEWKARIDWSHTWIFFGDERCVPPADANSNYRMAARALLEPAHIDPKHVLRIPTDLGSPAHMRARTNRNCGRSSANTMKQATGRASI